MLFDHIAFSLVLCSFKQGQLVMNHFSGIRAAVNVEALPTKQMWNEENDVKMAQVWKAGYCMTSGKKGTAGST